MTSKPTYEELELRVKTLETQLLLQETLKHDIKINNSFLKVLFDIIPSPMFYKDINGVYQHCNDAFSKTILGIPKEEILGKTLYELPEVIPKEYADIYYQKDKELFDNPGTQFYEGKVKCSDNISRDYHFYKTTFLEDEKVLGLVGLMLDVSDYKKALKELDDKNELLSNLSITDPLTNLFNRRYFEEIFQNKLTSLNRQANCFAFALIDIDYFKDYNDNYGHHAGDVALQKVSNSFKNTMHRANDYVFRIGGEEFVILFNVNSFENAKLKMEELRRNVEALNIDASNKTVNKNLTISIGLGYFETLGAMFNSDVIYSQIDKLLYDSKNSGKNRVTAKIINYS